MYKTKAKVFYDQFGGIAVVSCSEFLESEIHNSDIWEMFELEEKVEAGLYEVELEGQHESCDCEYPCGHRGYITFEVVGTKRIDMKKDQAL